MKFNSHCAPVYILLGNLFLARVIFSQFGDVQVSIDDQRLKETDRRITENIEPQIKQFFETTAWSEELKNTRIPLVIQFIFEGVTEKSGENIYSAQCLFSNNYDQRYYARSFQFPYSSSTGINYNPGLFNSLASTLEFYGYLILASEADSYVQLGGSPLFEKTKELAFRGKSSLYPRGWDNRLELVDQLSKNTEFRLAKFHFYQGFSFLKNKKISDASISFQKMIENLELVFSKFPREHYTTLFLNAHAKELVTLPPRLSNRQEILEALAEINADNKNLYQEALDKSSEQYLFPSK